VPAGWIWGNHGFLKHLGVVDVAGSGAVHLVGGTSGNQGSISPTFYEQLLCVKIPKVQKETDDLTVFLCFWDL